MINKDKFHAARIAVLAARAKLADFQSACERRHGPSWRYAMNKTEDASYERKCAAYERASARLFRLLEGSPRNWSSRVPAHWVNEDLTYEDAIRPLGEPLSVVPPCSYGETKPIA